MAKRLSEEMVIARTKISDLSKIKRLNCWGSELVDVSLLRRMPNVEVLSLSINKINSLEDFASCKKLEELYIRQNDIRDINQIVHLQSLANLKNLWLAENPCTLVDGYRMTVLRTLPQLQKLDNVAITADELKEAQRRGAYLQHPDDVQESDEEYIQQQQQQYNTNRYRRPSAEADCSPPQAASPVKPQEPDYETEEVEEYFAKEEPYDDPREFSPPSQSPPRRLEPVRQEYQDRRRNSYEREPSPKQSAYYDKSPPPNSTDDNETRMVTSHSVNSIKDYTNGDRHHSQVVQQQYQRQSDDGTSTYEGGGQRRERYQCTASHRPPFNRRPVTRNSNILSAALCLVKELDYPSLEVLDMAVRCRMDELDE